MHELIFLRANINEHVNLDVAVDFNEVLVATVQAGK